MMHIVNASARFWHPVRFWLIAVGLLLASVFSALDARAQSLQPIPPLTSLVVDQVGVLDATQKQALWQKLLAFEQTKGSQIGVLIVHTTAPEDTFSYAQRAAETYKLGRKGVGDGVLMVVAVDDRKVQVYVMRSLEGAIPDVLAKRIINEQITPAFKQGQYAQGIDAGVTQLMGLINGEALPPPKVNNNAQGADAGWMDVLILVGVLSIIGANIASQTSRWIIAPPAGGIAGLIAYSMTSVLGLGIGAGLVVLIFIMIFGSRSLQMATHRGMNPRGNDVFWGGGFGGMGGGMGGGSSGGGFGGGWGGSGGGGDAGGGGAGGGW